ncbi:MAG: AI-2E family transporter [Lachnospiraceae bacterium]|nr:AI-2E family transporter [Lachnospiraceae bacterium]
MKVNWNKKYTTIAVYALAVIALAVLFVVFVFKFEDFTKTFSWVGSVAAPIICGVVIAYVLNPLMMYLENKVFRRIKEGRPPEQNIVIRKLHNSPVGDSAVVKSLEKHSAPMEKKLRTRRKIARILSLVTTYLIIIALIVGIGVAVFPSVATSVVDLANQMPGYISKLEVWVNKMFEDYPDVAKFISTEVHNFADLVSKIAESIQPIAGDLIGNVSEGVIKFLGSLFVGLKNFLLGFIIAIYLLYSKERLLAQCKKIIFAFFRSDRCERFFDGCSRSNDIFKKYIISNIVDAMIIFVFMAVGMLAMGMPYQMLIAVVCAVTNLIPFFGPFIGAIPCGVLILLVDPIKVIWFGIFVLVLQQIDGNIIKPFLFGETMGLPAIWVLISIIVGGGLFGIPGMLLGAPVFAVFYMLFADLVSNKLEKKNLPGETELYTGPVDKFTEEYIPKPPETAPPKPAAETPAPKSVSGKPPQDTRKPNPKPQGNNQPNRSVKKK